MRFFNQGRLREQVRFLRRQYLQDGTLPFGDILSDEFVARAMIVLAHRFAAIAAGSPVRRDRDSQPATATHRTGVESPGGAYACRKSTAQHPRSWSPHGRSNGSVRR